MNALDELVGELDEALTVAYRWDKAEFGDIKKRVLEAKTILDLKGEQLEELYEEHKKLNRELEELELSSQNLENIQVEEVKAKNATRLAKKSAKKAARLYELNTQLTERDKEVLFKRRLTLYIIKKYLGFHVEPLPGSSDFNIISWSEDSPVSSTCVKTSPGNDVDYSQMIWKSLSRKSNHYDKWNELFKKS